MAATFCVSTSAELQSALTVSGTNSQGDSIQVKQGTYNGNYVYASTESFGVTIEGGYSNALCTLRDVDPANTVLDAGGSGPVLVFSAPDVLADFAVDGLTLQNGNVNSHGGGLYAVTDGTVTLTNNIISDNIASNYGGGIFFRSYYTGTVTLTNNIISNNSAANEYGGGGYFYSKHGTVTLTNNTINNNYAYSGGGYIINSKHGTVTLTNNIISNNSAASGSGGGGYFSEDGTVTLTNNIISDNIASNGGGVYFYPSSGTVTLTNNTINNNIASNGGGGYFNSKHGTVTLTNNTINNNIANFGGGGAYILLFYDDAITNIYNNIVWNNGAGEGGDLYIENDGDTNYFPSTVNIYNNDFDQSADGIYIQIPFPMDPSNLDDEDPIFVDPVNDDYHLTAGSPCKDTGDNTAPELPEKDMDGQPRIMDGVVDMGAYEYPGDAEPIADFSAEPLSGRAPLTVDFIDKSGGTIDAWEWNFGDNSPISHEQNPSHVYDTPGIYTVTLTVSGPYGSDTEINADFITVALANPKVDIKANGQDDPLFITPSESCNITVSLDPGSFEGVWFDWWIGAATTYGTYWYNSLFAWEKSDIPISVAQYPLVDLPAFQLLDIPLPGGIYTFFFVLDENPNGIFDSMALYDYVVVIVEHEALEPQMEALPDFDSLFQEKIKELMRK